MATAAQDKAQRQGPSRENVSCEDLRAHFDRLIQFTVFVASAEWCEFKGQAKLYQVEDLIELASMSLTQAQKEGPVDIDRFKSVRCPVVDPNTVTFTLMDTDDLEKKALAACLTVIQHVMQGDENAVSKIARLMVNHVK